MRDLIAKRNKRGFTVAELLIVIAILVILIGLGVPGFLTLRKNIQIAKYDDIAREIYVAAQNQLTRLAANGLENGAEEALTGAASITAMPSDYAGGETAWTAVAADYHHANKSDAAMDWLLPLGAVSDDLRTNGHYVIEYNARTYTVYAVFYAEKGFNYPNVANTTNAAGTVKFRASRDVRKIPMVGYYGGSTVLREEQPTLDTPKLEIINNNELRLNILNVPTDVTVSVTVSDGVEGHKPYPVSWIQNDGLDTKKKTVLLDGMKAGEHFHELFRGVPLNNISALTPGNDLTITVTYSKDGALPSSASVTANSLFATREPQADTENTVNGVNGDIVTIAWARHLQNLENSVSNLNDPTITLARQTDHIQWDRAKFASFVSIKNDGANANFKRYEGNFLEIRDLYSINNGLFANANNKNLSGICIVNPTIEASASAPVGVLAGTADNAEIASCGVYCRALDSDGNVVYTNYPNYGVTNSGPGFVGGLVGSANGAKIGYSFAALPVIKAAHGASLVGSAVSCEINNSYANCDDLPTENFNYFLSGTGNTVQHCYAVGNVKKREPGVFVPAENTAGNTVSNSYYAVSHSEWVGGKKTDIGLTECYYRKDATDNWTETNCAGLPAAPLTGWNTMSAPLTHPYREYLDSRAYPYPAIGALDHYGSWPDSDGKVNLTITMQLPNNPDAGYAIFAGQVVVKTTKDAEGKFTTTIFDSEEHKKSDGTFDRVDTVSIDPNTEIEITVIDAAGYAYVNTQIGDNPYDTSDVLTATVKKDTEVIVNFQQDTYKLTCDAPLNDQGALLVGGTYLAVLGDTSSVRAPGHNDKVETGTPITVQLPTQTGSMPVVWYTCDGSTEENYLVPNAQGNYTFYMPSANTTIHVKYTQKVAKFTVQYYVMDPEADPNSDGSKYPAEATNTIPVNYAIGTKITQDVVDILAENYVLTIGDTEVLYLDSAELSKKDGRPYEISDGMHYDTSNDDDGTEFTLKIMIARKRSTVTLKAGEHIRGVYFKDKEGNVIASSDQDTTSVTYYYGKKLTAVAEVASGLNFTTWEPDTDMFRASSSIENAIEVPYFDLTLTARAIAEAYQVTLSLRENEESWLAGSASRLADPVEIWLESTKDPKMRYKMRIPNPEAEEISYIAEATIVKSIQDISHGYYIRVYYTKSDVWEYAKVLNETGEAEKRIIRVRDRPVDENLDFYTVTYYPDLNLYGGTVPPGGTYLQFHKLKVPGNVNNLRNYEDDRKVFAGWYDAGVDGEGVNRTEVDVGQEYTVTRRTDFFANWQKSLKVMYNANDDRTYPATGELPVDNTKYQAGETVTIKAGSLTRKGYTFQGWAMNPDVAVGEKIYQPNETFAIDVYNVTLYAVWQREEYTLTFLNPDETVIQTIGNLHYGDKVDAPDCKAPDGSVFLGWSTTPFGDVTYPKGSQIQVTGNQTFYPRFDTETVEVIYHYDVNYPDDPSKTVTVKVGKGIPFYLNCEKAGDITAWRTEDSATFYLCEEGSARSLETVVFTEDMDLYAVTGRVYNFNQQRWYETLHEAVNADATAADDTLIVYRDTKEPDRIEFKENLYVLANGNRTVTWKNARGSNLSGENEFVGCMYVHGTADKEGTVQETCTVQFGKTNISNLSMNGTLTFDAAAKSRVMALGAGARFYMYDGITFTNGYRKPTDDHGWTSDDVRREARWRSYVGGGVYAGLDSEFYMRGGTISYCSAYRGGGVFLHGDKEHNKGSKMYMGEMATPTTYSATAIYYNKDDKYYVNQAGVTVENYRNYYVATGNPEICYNTATQKYEKCTENGNSNFGITDGGGGLLMLDLPDGYLELYKGRIHNNEAYANGGGIVTDGGGKNGDTDLGNTAQLRIYEVDISHNKAGGFGGGIFQWQGVIHIYNSTIRQNYSAECGGGIYLHHFGTETSDVNFYFGDISDNEAVRDGGGVYVEKGLAVRISGGNLRNNLAGQGGGGVYLAGKIGDNKYSELLLSSGAIYDNKGNHKDKEKWNDVYLNDGSCIKAMEGGLNLSTNNSGQKNPQITVDGYNGRALKEKDVIVNYEKSADFKAEDADLFNYLPNDAGTNELQVMPSTADIDGSPKDPLILKAPGEKETRTLEFYKNDGSEDALQNPVRKEVEVGTVFKDFPSKTSDPPFDRVGYYIGGWARNPDAYEENYVAYYNSVDGQWYMKYEVVDGKAQWTQPADVPTYTVDEKFDQKFYAMWKPYVVRYNLSNADTSVEPMADSIGPTVEILGPKQVSFDRDGVTYSFRGWSREPNAKTPDPNYAVSEEITLTESNLTLYAVWRPDVVKITLNFNGGSNQSGRPEVVETVTRGESLTIRPYGIANGNKGFAGWSINQDAVEPDPDYAEGQTINTGDDTEDLTLYAVWKDTYTVTFHLNGGQVNGSIFDRTQNVVQSEAISLNERPTREGYAFKGWAETEEKANNGTVDYKPDASMRPEGDMDLYAVWEAVPTTQIAEELAEPPTNEAPVLPQATDETAQQ